MRSRTIYRSLFALLAATFGMQAISHAAVQNRITSAVQENSRVALAHNIVPRAASASDLGEVPADLKLANLSLRFNMTDAQQAALTQLLADQQNPGSPRYHQWLTPVQFAAQFGLSAADIAKVSSWLTAHGFVVTGVANGGTFINFTGTAGQVKQAFGTSLHKLSLNGEQHTANLSDPTLPVAIANVVGHISGLNDFRPKSRLHRTALASSSVGPKFTAADGSHYMAPDDFYTIYDLNPLLTNGINGAGIKIAVMGQVDLTATDVSTFRSVSGLPANPYTVTTYGTDPGPVTTACLNLPAPANCFPSADDLDESLLDVEWSGAVAPSAQIVFVNSQDVIGLSLVNAIDNNIAPIMTVSYGNCESAYSINDINALNVIFQQANAQGITVFGPAGDSGATDCDAGVSSATQGLAVDFPASSPYVTGVGGTTFSGDTAASVSSYWNTTNGTNSGSAKMYIPEAVWNETALDLSSSPQTPQFGAGGGGASIIFAKPAWQAGTGVPNDFVRDVPDVSLNAAANHDGYLVCAEGSCTNNSYFTTVNTSTGQQSEANVFGGTSVATPSFAAILSLVEQKLGGTRLGNINPTLYALAATTNYNSIFHDVTSGNNDSPCTTGTPNCPNGGQIGFNAGTGYDQATGLGSVDVAVLANDWKTGAPVSSGALTPSATTLTTTTALPVSAGTSVALAIKVATSLPTSTATPSGSVQITVDGVANGSPISLSGAAATYSLNTSSLASGVHVVGAVYSGDATYSSSLGTLNVDIISASAADFTLTPSITSITVAGGVQSSAITFTVTPKNGFVGTIAFTSSGGIAGTYAFSANPATVNITSTTASATIQYAIEPAVGDVRNGQLKKLASNQNPASPGTSGSSRAPWYAAGSGSVLACLLLITIPRRRRWGALLAAILTVAALGAGGCSSSSSAPATTPTAPTAPTNPTTPTSTVVTHSATVTVQVAQAGSTTPNTYTVLVTAVGTPSK